MDSGSGIGLKGLRFKVVKVEGFGSGLVFGFTARFVGNEEGGFQKLRASAMSIVCWDINGNYGRRPFVKFPKWETEP